MSEEIDMEMTEIHNAMDQGLCILAAEKRRELEHEQTHQQLMKVARKESFKFLPEAIRPFAKIVDIDIDVNYSPTIIWFRLDVPDLAKIAVIVNRFFSYALQRQEIRVKYHVFDPNIEGDPFAWDEWNEHIVYKDIEDHRIALARAYQVMENYRRQKSKVQFDQVEPEYVTFYQDQIYAITVGQFATPLVTFFSTYVLNELMNLIDKQIDKRLAQVKK